MEKIIFDNGACKLTEIFGDYRLYSVSTVDMDGIDEIDISSCNRCVLVHTNELVEF